MGNVISDSTEAIMAISSVAALIAALAQLAGFFKAFRRLLGLKGVFQAFRIEASLLPGFEASCRPMSRHPSVWFAHPV
jgi:hypothetical protein